MSPATSADLALVGRGQVAGEAVQVDGDSDSRVRVEQLSEPAAIMPARTSPVPPVAMPGLPVRLIDVLPVGRRDDASGGP